VSGDRYVGFCLGKSLSSIVVSHYTYSASRWFVAKMTEEKDYVADYRDCFSGAVARWISGVSHGGIPDSHPADSGRYIHHFPLPSRRDTRGLEQEQSYCKVSGNRYRAFS
jgi:hypothetical protein